MKTSGKVCVRKILVSKEPGIVNPPAGRQREIGVGKGMRSCPDFKHRCVVRTAVAVELAELYASRSIQTYFGCHLIIKAYVHLLESLVGTWSIHPIVPECAPNAHRYLWQPIVVKVKAARNSVVTNVTVISVRRRIKLARQ